MFLCTAGEEGYGEGVRRGDHPAGGGVQALRQLSPGEEQRVQAAAVRPVGAESGVRSAGADHGDTQVREPVPDLYPSRPKLGD